MLLFFLGAIVGTGGCDNESYPAINPCNDSHDGKAIEFKNLKTTLTFAYLDPLGMPVLYGKGLSYYPVSGKTTWHHYIYEEGSSETVIVFSYRSDVCNFPDYATLWENQEKGDIDVILSGKLYPSLESENEIYGILELTSLKLR